MKYWLGAGRGGFGLSSIECVRPTFYCQVYTTALPDDVDDERYMRVKTSEVPIKPSFFATLKSTNYLPNVLAVMDAQADGHDQVTLFSQICCSAVMDTAVMDTEDLEFNAELYLAPLT